jgi:lysophospholipase L1-like esterase
MLSTRRSISVKKLLIAVLFLTLLGLSAGIATATAPKDQLPKVLIIGDSISWGYTPHVTEMLKGLAEVKHCPANAGPTMRGVENIDKWLGDGKWDVILFNFGLWDMYGWRYEKIDRSPAAYEKRLDALAIRLKKTGAKLIWATTTPACPEPERNCKVRVDPATEKKYLDAALRVMKKHSIQVNDLYAFMKPIRAKYAKADNDVHYKKDGKKLLGQQVADQIKATLGGSAGGQWISLFNGTDLKGWQGDAGIWRVKDGVIEGSGACSDHKGYKSYLINRSHILKDFIIEVEFNMAKGNSGVNYRCHDYDKDKKKLYEVSGYQADISGIGLWDIYTTSASKRYSVKKASGGRAKSNQWHTLRIEARGNKFTHSLNGAKSLEFVDTDTRGGFREKGFIALEFHDNGTNIKFRNIRVKILTPPAAKKSPKSDKPKPATEK